MHPAIMPFCCIPSSFGESFSETFNLGSYFDGGNLVLVWTGVILWATLPM